MRVRPILLAAFALALVVPAGSAAGGDWPLFRGADGSGAGADPVPESPVLLWDFATTRPITSSPVIAGGRVFIGGEDGRLYALDLRTGEVAWSHDTGGAIEAPPSILGGRVIIGNDDGILTSLAMVDGKPAWTFDAGDKIIGAANGALDGDGGAIVFGCYDSCLHAVDAEDGKPLWKHETDGYLNGMPARWGDNWAIGGCDQNVYVISGDGKERLAAVDLGSYVPGSVVVAGDRAYAGHFGNRVACIDLKAAGIAWEFTAAEDAFFSSAAVAGQRVLIGCRNGRLYCLKASDGAEEWSFRARDSIDSSPVVAGDRVVFGSDDGRLYIVDLASGRMTWSYDVGRPLTSSPGIADGVIVIGCQDGRVYAFGPKP